MNMDKNQNNMAKHFGLEELRAGGHIIRDERRWRKDELEVSRCWQASILPSFHQAASLTTVHFQEHEFRGKVHSKEILACMVIDDSSIPIGPVRVDKDPVEPLLRSINLSPEEDYVTLDGIGYSISIQLLQTKSSLTIHSPIEESHVAIETGLFELATAIQSLSKSKELINYLKIWKEYLH
jgi:hypothetical protein